MNPSDGGGCFWGGLQDFDDVPARGLEWSESLAPTSAFLVTDLDFMEHGPSYLASLQSLHDNYGKSIGFESYFFADLRKMTWAFDPTTMLGDDWSPIRHWYDSLDVLAANGMADDMVFFLDTFDTAHWLGIQLFDLSPAEYAGPVIDEVKAIREHAPTAFIAIHMLLPYSGFTQFKGSDIVTIQLDQIEALINDAGAKGTFIDGISFDNLGIPLDGSLEIDLAGFEQLLDAIHSAGLKAGVIVTSHEGLKTPEDCGFPRSGQDYEASAVRGINTLKASGLDTKIDFYNLSSWARYPSQALPQNQAGALTHVLCSVENALGFECIAT